MQNANNTKHQHWDSMWPTSHSTYIPNRIVFVSICGPKRSWGCLPLFTILFHMFWPLSLLRSIANETNWYACTPGLGGFYLKVRIENYLQW